MEARARYRTPLANPHGLITGARFLARVPGFIRDRFTLEQARAVQADHLRRRETRFLEFLKRAVFDSHESVLLRLFRHAGISHPDVEELVAQYGLEGALKTLFHNGIYVAVDEFKGRKPLVRGSLRLDITPPSLRNPLAAFHVAARSGGSRSAAAPFLIDLEYIRACAIAFAIYLDAHGGSDWDKATWETPGAGSRFRLLKCCCFGRRPVAWFTQVDPSAAGLDPVFRWSDRALRWGGLLGGVRVPRPVLASPEEPLAVARWMRGVLDNRKVPHLMSFSSSIVRLATAALDADIDLTGAYATVMGEPTTQTRLDTIRKCGLNALPRYGSIEAGPIGYACRNADAADDVHVVRDLQAVITAGSHGTALGMPKNALLLTALHAAAPFTMINFSMGDQADLIERQCRCPMERLGWGPHLLNIRSYEKLTAGGVTFDDAMITGLLEEVLPQRFGGNPTDYQLVEQESIRGEPALVLRVHPRVGPVSVTEIKRELLAGLGGGPAVNQLMVHGLQNAVEIRVERSVPLTTRSSKILHLHVNPAS
ncbi:MAG: hypothetical protein OEU36_14590 [Gammaproteobacteria bacterium]|nr:hypothetical protein [Gammaproteobacteria bacterium]